MDLAENQQAIEEHPKDQQAGGEAEIERDFAPGGAGVALLEDMKAEAWLTATRMPWRR